MFGTKERKTPLQREVDEHIESLRDDCVALFLNSKLTMNEVHARGGPTPNTISKWLYKETKFPQLRTIDSFLRALGHRLVIDKTVTNRGVTKASQIRLVKR